VREWLDLGSFALGGVMTEAIVQLRAEARVRRARPGFPRSGDEKA